MKGLSDELQKKFNTLAEVWPFGFSICVIPPFLPMAARSILPALLRPGRPGESHRTLLAAAVGQASLPLAWTPPRGGSGSRSLSAVAAVAGGAVEPDWREEQRRQDELMESDIARVKAEVTRRLEASAAAASSVRGRLRGRPPPAKTFRGGDGPRYVAVEG